MINVTKTYLPDKEKYQHYLDRIYESGWLTNNGELVQELERRLAKYLDVPFLVLTANGTLAIQVATKLLQLDGEVITTPFSFVATVSGLVWEGLSVRLADIDPKSFTLDPANLKPLINDKTTAIMPVHVYGNVCDDESISTLAKENGLKVIYDAAHVFGVSRAGTAAGNFGDVSVFSFHSTKLFHTIEGGAIVVPDRELYEKAKLCINFGISGPEHIDTLGINAKMNEFEAAMGLCILDDMEKILSGRKQVFYHYFNELSSIAGLEFQQLAPDLDYNYAYFPLLFPTEETLLTVKMAMESQSIFPRRYFYPSLSQLPYMNFGDSTPVADDISKRILCLPIYYDLPELDQQRILDIIIRYMK